MSKPLGKVLVFDIDEKLLSETVQVLENAFFQASANTKFSGIYSLLADYQQQVVVCNATSVGEENTKTIVSALLNHETYPIIIARFGNLYARCIGLGDKSSLLLANSNDSIIDLLYWLLKQKHGSIYPYPPSNWGNFYIHNLGLNLDGHIAIRKLFHSKHTDWALLQYRIILEPAHYIREYWQHIFSIIEEVTKQVISECGTEYDVFDDGDYGFLITLTQDYEFLKDSLLQRFNGFQGFQRIDEADVRLRVEVVHDARKSSAQSLEEIAETMNQKWYEQAKKDGLAW